MVDVHDKTGIERLGDLSQGRKGCVPEPVTLQGANTPIG